MTLIDCPTVEMADQVCMVVYGGVWWCMVVYGGVWWCMVVYGGVWWCMVVYGVCDGGCDGNMKF